MKKRIHHPKGYSVRALALEFAIDHKTLLTALRKTGIKTGASCRVTILQAHNALTSRADKKGDMQSERLRKIREEANILELERREKELELVSIAEVQEMVGQYAGPIRTAWLALPQALAIRCNPTDPEIAERALSDWVKSAMRLTQKEFAAAAHTPDVEDDDE